MTAPGEDLNMERELVQILDEIEGRYLAVAENRMELRTVELRAECGGLTSALFEVEAAVGTYLRGVYGEDVQVLDHHLGSRLNRVFLNAKPAYQRAYAKMEPKR